MKKVPAGFLLLEFMVALALFVVMIGILGGFFSYLIKTASVRMETAVACQVASDVLEKIHAGIQMPAGETGVVVCAERRMSVGVRPAFDVQPGQATNELGPGGCVVTVGWQSIIRCPMQVKLAG